MLIPLKLLKEYVDINVDDKEFVRQFSLKSAEVDSFAPFVNVNGLLIGKILKVREHPDSNHLHITTVDTGDTVQDIVCGAPNVMEGKKVIVAKEGVSLPGGVMKKALIRGVESCGMNCSLEEIGIDPKFQGYEGIYYLDDDAPIGIDPIEYLHLNDMILEIELTPNRSDLLSIIGVAHDTAAMLNTSFHLDAIKYKEKEEAADISVSTETTNCRAYYSQVIKNVEIKESPSWLKGALIKMNIRPINNVVDVTNYVLMITGQPLHAFNYQAIKTKRIVVKMAEDEEKFYTLDNKERVLSKEDIVITDGKTPLCLAGVMGGINSEVENDTTDIFLESANFNPKNIQATSKRLDLVSESSTRFEKGIDPLMSKYALDLASYLLEKLANGEVLKGGACFDNLQKKNKEIEISLDKIEKVLARHYSSEEIDKVFLGLSFDFSFQDGVYKVSVPPRRSDIETYQDLIEEIVRINGYEKISSTIPASYSAGKLNDYQKFIRKLRHLLSANLNEVITYSLVDEKEVSYFDNKETKKVKISNPLSDERVYMRHSLLPSLLNVMKYNVNRKIENNFIFEIGRNYTLDKEETLVSGALSGFISSTLWNGKKEEVDFFYLKGLLEYVFTKLSIKNYCFTYPSSSLKGLHPGVSAVLLIGREPVGFIGLLHPETQKELDVPKAFVFEINAEKLYSASHPLKTVKEISKYPSIKRDLALVVPSSLTAESLMGKIKKYGKRSLSDINIFDLYTGEKLEKDKKQLALTLTFSDMKRTLEAVEVDSCIAEILAGLLNEGITLRE